MALPASGPLALTDIQTEFGGANPIGMNEYYAGGGLVPAGTSGTYGAVPSSGALSVQNFYGTSNFVPVYVEDVFSAYLYTGNNAGYPGQTITNGINLASNGGMVWVKSRTSTSSHELYSSAQGLPLYLRSDSSGQGYNGGLNTFTTTGFQVDNNSNINSGSQNYDSWTFRKQPKFFDAVAYTGNGVDARAISHSLGATPGCIIIKKTSGVGNWAVWHRSLNSGTGNGSLFLNTTDPYDNNGSFYFGNRGTGTYIAPTSTQFTVSYSSDVNANGETYVAYLFAHDAGGFGLTGSDNVISCGSFTGATTVNLGYEPQWVLLKSTTATQDWFLIDTMMGWTADGTYNFVQPNNNYSEAGGTNGPRPTSTGFYWPYGGNTYIYIAIRRGPMKVPTSGTSVFSPITTSGASGTVLSTGFRSDMTWGKGRTFADGTYIDDRLRGYSSGSTTPSPQLNTTSTAAEDTSSYPVVYNAGNTSALVGAYFGGYSTIFYNFQRAPSFFDEVCYTGNGAGASQVNNHNLGVVPELIISKKRSATGGWVTWATGLSGSTYYLQLNTTDGEYNGGATLFRSSTQYTWYWGDNVAGATYVTYLFASCPGVSKVGSYSGTGSTQTISCGFTGGARWVMIKRIDVDGYGWYTYDSARGISSGNDPYLLLNSTAAEVTGTNYVDTTSVGFQVTAAAPAGINASGGTYIFLAIA